MDLTGSLIDTNLKIHPTKALLDFLTTIPYKEDLPANLSRLLKKTTDTKELGKQELNKTIPIQLSNEDIKNLNSIRKIVQIDNDNSEETDQLENDNENIQSGMKESEEITEVSKEKEVTTTKKSDKETLNKPTNDCEELLEHKCQEKEKDEKFLTTSDIDWLYNYIHGKRGKGENVPYLHDLLKGAVVEMPDNEVIKRNPVLEARCVKLRAQQEAREYRKMTKSVDNVRMRFPEDSINYQLKQVNRQLIAIGQFIISIFAGFLFGFRGVEWMVGNLDFGFRLLLGVMCALVIALAEIYFLAKKLNEELNVPETVQLGGPPKFADDTYNTYTSPSKAIEKEHQD